MNFPQLPTDNLYKFIALFGLFLLGVYFVLPYVAYYHEADQEREIEQESTSRNIDLEADISKFQAELDKAGGPDMEPRTESKVKELQSRLDQLKFVRQHIQYLRTDLHRRREYLKEINSNCKVAGLCGCLLGGFGFSIWWYKVQRYQDQLIRLEVEKATRDLATPKASGA